MPLTVNGRRNYSSQEATFSLYDFSALLDIKSTPQQVADNALTIAQNFYGRVDGGLELRKGFTTRGAVAQAAHAGLGIARFFQQVVNSAVQSPSTNRTMVQTSGGQLFIVDPPGPTQVGGANVLGANGLPWSTQPIFDPDHQIPTPAAPTNNAPAGGGALAAGTYLVSVTWVNASGETVNGPDDTIAILLNQQVVINQPSVPVSPPPTGWRVYASTANGARGTETLQSATIPIGTTTFTFSTLLAGAAPPSANTTNSAYDILVMCTGDGGPYAYDGTQVYVPAAWSANVASARWCQVVNNVLWFAGIPSQPNLVVGMQLGHPETFSGANTFTFSHPVTGLAILGAGAQASLVVGMEEGLAVLYGTGPETFYEQEVPDVDGVQAGRSMVTVDGVVYWLGGNAIYRFDGTSLTRISDRVEPWILNDPLSSTSNDFPMNGDRTKSWAMFYNNRIYFWYISGSVMQTALVWDLNLQGWTCLNIGAGGPTPIAGCLYNAPGDASPPIAVLLDGAPGNSQPYNFDVYNGSGHNVDDNGTLINASVLSKFFKIGEPGVQKDLMRVDFELFVDATTTTMGANLIAVTDYGGNSASEIAIAPATGAVFGTAIFGTSTFGDGSRTFLKQRVDIGTSLPNGVYQSGLPFEAVALGVTSNDSNPPYVFVGGSGVWVENPRSY